jgi:TatD DNase family protein
VIDTHCHLTFPDFAGRTAEVLSQAAAAGVTGAITISTTTHDCLDALAIAERFDNVWCSSGVHPLYADAADPRAAQRNAGAVGHVWENLRTVASHRKCVAWGELGLDNHYADPRRDVQRRVLDEQLAFIQGVNHDGPGGIGKAHGLPVVLHCREAFDDESPVLRRTNLRPERFVFHCFTGTPEDMRQLLDFGACVSFTGVLTYPNAPEVREAARLAPADRIMVETDAPFLPPVPHRGKRPCVPAWVAHTAQALAAVRGVKFEDLHEQLNRNTERFFGVPAAASVPGPASSTGSEGWG